MDWLDPRRATGWPARTPRAALTALALLFYAGGCGDDGATPGDDDDDDDVPVDAGPMDAGPEEDAGPTGSACVVGNPCTAAADCTGLGVDRSRVCIAEEPGLIGVAGDPVDGLDGPVSVTDWIGGYCSTEGVVGGFGCRQDSDCGRGPEGELCGRCVDGTDITGDPVRQCFQRCSPSADGNSGCREGYECDWISETCQPGCSADVQCRVFREDTNGNGVVDPFNPIVNRDGDRLVLDAAAEGATCNATTYRCDQPGNPEATAGDPCDRDSQCMENGFCVTEGNTDGVYEDGYCTRFGCRAAGRTCDGEDEICMGKDFLAEGCLLRCTVGAEEENDLLRLGPDGRGLGCRRGYRCAWDGRSLDEGGCLPGNYNGIASPNLGGPCGALAPAPVGLDDSRCWSPFGAGVCTGFPLNNPMDPDNPIPRSAWTACALRDCFAPGIGDACINAGGQCVERANTGAGEPSDSICLPRCNQASDCPPFAPGSGIALACNETLVEGTGVCTPSCLDQDGEPDSRRCAMGMFCSEMAGGICIAM